MRAPVCLCLGVLVGCSTPDPVRVGSKTFTENRVLAEAMAIVLESEGLTVERHLDFGDTFACQEGVQGGALDLYPEYTGTALAALGLRPRADADAAWTELQDRTADLGLAWPVRFGFDNPYVLVTTPSVAARHGLRSLSDLAPALGEEEPGLAYVAPSWRVAASPEFLERPLDGFGALGRFYGIPEWEASVVSLEPDVRFGALLAGEVDLVVADGTAAFIDTYGLVVLDDDLGFFPAYEAAPVVRQAALRKHPGLDEALDRLDGVLTRPMVRRANRAVDIDGADLREVAEDLLVDAGLLDAPAEADVPALEVAVPPGDEAPRLVGLALKAMRESRPGHRVRPAPVTDPVGSVAAGDASLGVVASPALFRPGTGRPRARDDVEAVAALGHVALHWVGRADGPGVAQATRLGVGPEGSTAYLVGAALIDAYGLGARVVTGEPEAQLAELDAGALDAVLVIDEVGSAAPTLALRGDGRQLLALDDWAGSDRGFRHPYLRPWRIPAGSYPSVREPVPTVGAQLVLAAPRRARQELGEGGPAAALEPTDPRWTESQLGRLRAALIGVPLDPVLPRRRATRQAAGPALPLQPAVTLANVATFGFLAFLLWLLARGTSRVE